MKSCSYVHMYIYFLFDIFLFDEFGIHTVLIKMSYEDCLFSFYCAIIVPLFQLNVRQSTLILKNVRQSYCIKSMSKFTFIKEIKQLQ